MYQLNYYIECCWTGNKTIDLTRTKKKKANINGCVFVCENEIRTKEAARRQFLLDGDTSHARTSITNYNWIDRVFTFLFYVCCCCCYFIVIAFSSIVDMLWLDMLREKIIMMRRETCYQLELPASAASVKQKKSMMCRCRHLSFSVVLLLMVFFFLFISCAHFYICCVSCKTSTHILIMHWQMHRDNRQIVVHKSHLLEKRNFHAVSLMLSPIMENFTTDL